MRRPVGCALLALLLTGCGAFMEAGVMRPDPREALRAFAVSDLREAVALAIEGEDDAALMCYQFLLEQVQALQARPAAGVRLDSAGPISSIQRFRNGLHGPQASQSRSFFGRLDLHCAAYRTSVEIDLVKGALAGAAAAGGNVGALRPALKALLPLLGVRLP